MHAVCAGRGELRDRLAGAAVRGPPPLFSGHIAGGTHHAFYSRGEGFCIFSDIAVSFRSWLLLAEALWAGVGGWTTWNTCVLWFTFG